MTLYDLTAEMLDLYDLLMSGEIDDQTYTDTLESLAFDSEAKLEGYAKLIRSMEAEADAYIAEAARLTAKRRARENAVARLKERIAIHLTATGQTGAKAGLFSWSLRTSKAVAITDESELPMSVLRVKSEPDKTEIRRLLDAGEKVPGATIEERFSVVLK
jgi:hypothetical protein